MIVSYDLVNLYLQRSFCADNGIPIIKSSLPPPMGLRPASRFIGLNFIIGYNTGKKYKVVIIIKHYRDFIMRIIRLPFAAYVRHLLLTTPPTCRSINQVKQQNKANNNIMKTLLSVLVLVAISFGGGESEKPEASEKKDINHALFATPAEFGFGTNYYLDADKDGKADFLFTTVYENENGTIHTKYMVDAIGENEILTVDNDAAIADDGNTLESFGNLTWKNQPASILEQVVDGGSNGWKGLWSGDRDQYVGIKIVKDGKAYTGWVKVFINQSSEQAQVDGYAINKVAGNTINAGEI